MSKQNGRKALIILSDGVDRGSKENLVKAIEAAQRADTILYAIYFKGEESHYDNDRSRGGFPGGRGGGFPGGGRYPGGGDIPAEVATPAAVVGVAIIPVDAAARATSTAKRSWSA